MEPLKIKQNKAIRTYFFSSPGQSPGRAIVLPPASVLASALAIC